MVGTRRSAAKQSAYTMWGSFLEPRRSSIPVEREVSRFLFKSASVRSSQVYAKLYTVLEVVSAPRCTAGWDEAIPQMTRGQVAIVTCPHEKAYGARGAPPVIPPFASLDFEVELLDFY